MMEKYFECHRCNDLLTETELLVRCSCGKMHPEEDRITKAEYKKKKGIVTLNETLKRLSKK